MAKDDSNSLTLTAIGAVIIIVIVIVAVLLIKSKHSTATVQSLTPAQTASAKQQIEKNWTTFFAAATPLSTRENLLQNGTTFAQPIEAEFAGLGKENSSAVISNVDVENSSSASVAYSVDLNGEPVLKDQSGQAVLANNTWKVSDSTLCGLLSMGGYHPSVCKNL